MSHKAFGIYDRILPSFFIYDELYFFHTGYFCIFNEIDSRLLNQQKRVMTYSKPATKKLMTNRDGNHKH